MVLSILFDSLALLDVRATTKPFLFNSSNAVTWRESLHSSPLHLKQKIIINYKLETITLLLRTHHTVHQRLITMSPCLKLRLKGQNADFQAGYFKPNSIGRCIAGNGVLSCVNNSNFGLQVGDK
jgi:hypothetical protein